MRLITVIAALLVATSLYFTAPVLAQDSITFTPAPGGQHLDDRDVR